MELRMNRAAALALNWKAIVPALSIAAVVGFSGMGEVAAVTIAQTTKTLMGVRATTDASTVVVATHTGVNVALTASAGAADTAITAHASDATTPFRAGALAAGDFYYGVKFASTATGDDIPAGTLRLRWTTAGAQQSASLPVTGATVAAGATGGFTVLIPGSASDTPENIQAVFEQ